MRGSRRVGRELSVHVAMAWHGARRGASQQPRTLTLPVSSTRLLTLDGGSPLPASLRFPPLADKCRRGRAAAAGVLRLEDGGEWRCVLDGAEYGAEYGAEDGGEWRCVLGDDTCARLLGRSRRPEERARAPWSSLVCACSLTACRSASAATSASCSSVRASLRSAAAAAASDASAFALSAWFCECSSATCASSCATTAALSLLAMLRARKEAER